MLNWKRWFVQILCGVFALIMVGMPIIVGAVEEALPQGLLYGLLALFAGLWWSEQNGYTPNGYTQTVFILFLAANLFWVVGAAIGYLLGEWFAAVMGWDVLSLSLLIVGMIVGEICFLIAFKSE